MEISCKNCSAVCCKGSLTLELTLEEAAFMIKGGTKLITIAQPADHDRTDIIYPRGMEIDPETGKGGFLVEKGREYEPLAAGFGRYSMWGTCGYLKTDESGWEYCSTYENRPAVCQEFEETGEKCQLLRLFYGVDPPPNI